MRTLLAFFFASTLAFAPLLAAAHPLTAAPSLAFAQSGASAAQQSQTPAQVEADLAEAGRQHALAVQLFNERKYAEAVGPARRALELREKSVGPEHYLTRTSLFNLAHVLLAKQDYEESLKVFRRLLAVDEKVLKPGSDDTVKVVERIASLYTALHRLGDAEKALKRAVELRETGAGADSPLTALALYRLATFYHLTARPEEAKPLYRRAVSIWEKDTGGRTGEYFEALERYSCLLRDEDERQADELQRRAEEVSSGSGVMGGSNEKTPAAASGDDSETVIRGGVLNGKAISKPAPEYPATAIATRAQGAVVVRVMVDETGRVILACAISGDKLLRGASERAAYGWRFTPTLLSGVPVKVTGTITFNFNLR